VPEFTSTPVEPMADITMAIGVMPQVPPGGESPDDQPQLLDARGKRRRAEFQAF